MKFLVFLGLAFASGSLATNTALSGGEIDIELERIDDVLPSRVVELQKRRKGGGGGGGGGDIFFDDDDDYDDDGGSSEPAPCVETPYTSKDLRTNVYGYNMHPSKGLGSKDSDIIGGYSKNGSGTPPEWRSDSGGWTHICAFEYDYQGDEYYFGGSKVPYRAGKTSPNGLVPSLAEMPYTEYDVRFPWTSPGCYDRADNEGGCPMRNTSYCYEYPYPYKYTESKRKNYWSTEGYTYDNVTTAIDILCCCTKNSICGCDDPGDASLVQAIVDHYSPFDDYGYSRLHNSTAGCYLSLNGSNVFMFNGSLEIGSTKANSSLPDYPDTKHTSICYGSSSRSLLHDVSYSLLLAIAFGVVWLSF